MDCLKKMYIEQYAITIYTIFLWSFVPFDNIEYTEIIALLLFPNRIINYIAQFKWNCVERVCIIKMR